MPITNGPQIAFSDLESEFGDLGSDGATISMSDFGIKVGHGTPVAGDNISLSEFYGLSNDLLLWGGLSQINIADIVFGAPADAEFIIKSDGTTDKGAGDLGNTEDWLSTTGAGTGALYEMRWTLNFGDALDSSGGLSSNVWGDMNVNRSFAILSPFGDSKATNISIDIRLISGPGSIESRSLQLTADSEPA